MVEENAEILSAFFASVVNKTSCSQGTQTPELQDWHREMNENPMNQGKMVSNFLHHLEKHKGIEGAGGRAHHSNHLSAVLAQQGGH